MKKIFLAMLAIAAAPVLLARTYSNLVPQPLKVSPAEGVFVMEKGLSISASDALESEQAYLLRHLEKVFAFDIDLRDVPVYNGISLNIVDGMAAEA